MRQWLVDPKLLCRKHLLGAHVEHHMFIGSLQKGRSIDGFIRDGLVEVHMLDVRHEEIAAEMLRRGYNHKSPLPEGTADLLYHAGRVDPQRSIKDLSDRCEECRERIKQASKVTTERE